MGNIMGRRKKVSLDNESLGGKVFSEVCQNSLKVLAIVCEWAAEDGFVGTLDEHYASTPQMVERMCDNARIALRALKKLEEREKGIGATKH
jgi:hypothetical protein